MSGVGDGVELAIGFITLMGAVLGWVRWIRPRVRAWTSERAAINEVLLGSPEVPANPITGAPAQPAKPSIGQLVRDMHHELHPNHGTSLKDQATRTEAGLIRVEITLREIVKRLTAGDHNFVELFTRIGGIEHVLADELHTANDTISNAAEASRVALTTIEAAIRAEPPLDLD